MKGALLVSMALGVMVGAIGVSLCKPAQDLIQRSAESIKDESKSLIEKTKQKLN